MNPLTKMLISLLAIFALFLANIFIMFARNKLTGVLKWTLTIFAYLMLVVSFLFIIIVIFTY